MFHGKMYPTGPIGGDVGGFPTIPQGESIPKSPLAECKTKFLERKGGQRRGGNFLLSKIHSMSQRINQGRLDVAVVNLSSCDF